MREGDLFAFLNTTANALLPRKSHRRACYVSSGSKKVWTCTSKRNLTRREAIQLLTIAPVGFLSLTTNAIDVKAAAKKSVNLEKLTAPIIMCRRVMEPVGRYIEEGAWDKGRTNVNYCTRVLAMRKNMRDAADQLSGDAYYDALDIMGEMVNNMSQLDASLYTPLFIPADDGQVTSEQGKYQSQARGFYKDALDGLNSFLNLIPEEVMKIATAIADKTKYEIPIESH